MVVNVVVFYDFFRLVIDFVVFWCKVVYGYIIFKFYFCGFVVFLVSGFNMYINIVLIKVSGIDLILIVLGGCVELVFGVFVVVILMIWICEKWEELS